MYTDRDFKTAKALREAVAKYLLAVCGRAPEKAREVTFYQPGGMFATKTDGAFTVEGPHGYNTFYVRCVARDGAIVWCNGLPAALNPEAKSYNLSAGIAALRTKYPEIDAAVNPKVAA